MRLTTDIFDYCHEHVPKWNTISISGYHIREKGCSAVQEVAFTLSNAIAYVEAALDRGLDDRRVRPAARVLLQLPQQRLPGDRQVPRRAADVGARSCATASAPPSERSQMIRFHTQTGGVTLQAQQPEVNIIRVALQGFAAVCGGTQSLHTNGFDEALALPTERSARIALRTQQVLAHESGAADTVDPFAGSYFVESLTDEIEARAWELMEKVEELGGSVNALEFIQREIEESAASLPRALPDRAGHRRRRQQVRDRHGRRRRHPQGRPGDRAAPGRAAGRGSRRPATRRGRRRARRRCASVAEGEGNLLYPIKDALRADASIGEVCGAMREVFGEYKGGAFF